MYKATRRFLGALLAGACISAAFPVMAEYPEKPITLIIPYKAGGSTETMGRVFSQALGDALGTTVIVKTRPGAGGAIGATEVSQAPADGYTLLFSASGVFAWPPLTQDVSYGPEDFTYISQISQYQMAIVARADAPYDTLEGLLEYAKDNNLNYADQGSTSRAFIDFVASESDVEWTAIPTKGGGEAMPFLLGGKVDFTYSGGVHGRYGDKMKVILALIGNRLAAEPDVPSIKEKFGIAMPGEAVISAPAGLPADIVAKLDAAIAEASMNEEFFTLLTEKLKFPSAYRDSAAITAQIAENYKSMQTVVEAMK